MPALKIAWSSTMITLILLLSLYFKPRAIVISTTLSIFSSAKNMFLQFFGNVVNFLQTACQLLPKLISQEIYREIRRFYLKWCVLLLDCLWKKKVKDGG